MTSQNAVIKCITKATGGLVGVALNTVSASTTATADVALEGVFDLSIEAGAAMGVGDYVYAAVIDSETSTAVLSDSSSGLLFGRLLQPITEANTVTREVLVVQPSHL